jgi:hypothetical protein
MKPEIERAMREVIEAWECPDSPEAFAGAMYQLKRIYEKETRRNTPQRRPQAPIRPASGDHRPS